jgi:hypothetical protein
MPAPRPEPRLTRGEGHPAATKRVSNANYQYETTPLAEPEGEFREFRIRLRGPIRGDMVGFLLQQLPGSFNNVAL